jgi:hypothetical protein
MPQRLSRDEQERETPIASIIIWALIPTVMYGGYALLNQLQAGQSAQELANFRAGHAHAGVLLILALGYVGALRRSGYTKRTRAFLEAAFLVGVVSQSGGFFITFIDPSLATLGYGVTVFGAALLTAAIGALVLGLARR